MIVGEWRFQLIANKRNDDVLICSIIEYAFALIGAQRIIVAG